MLKTCLYSQHTERLARMTSFSGWTLPLSYRSTREEHLHTRRYASLFDTSHMTQLTLRKKTHHPLDILAPFLTRDLSSSQIGRCYYTFLIDHQKHVIDDIIIYTLNSDEIFLVANAGTKETILSFLQDIASEKIAILHRQDQSKLDVQGPYAYDIFCHHSPFKKFAQEMGLLSYFSHRKMTFEGQDILISRTGYTGELGYEIFAPHNTIVRLWEELIQNPVVKPAGLSARDTLRLEMGFFLSGQDFNPSLTIEDITPSHKYDALPPSSRTYKDNPLSPISFILNEKSIPRKDHLIVNNDNEQVGVVTSGNYSFCLEKPIGLGLLSTPLSSHHSLFVAVRKSKVPLSPTPLPFIQETSVKKKIFPRSSL